MPDALAFPATATALQYAAELVRQAWVAAAEDLGGAVPPSYIAGLLASNTIVYPDQGDPLHVRVVNRSPSASSTEYGSPAVHLPTTIHWAQSRTAKRSKAGRYYLIIPFRHLTRARAGMSSTAAMSVMPSRIYRIARTLLHGQYLTSGPSGGRGVHAPGLRPYVPRNVRNIRLGYTHAAREERLRRTPGRSARQSTYLTFRTMTQDSPGWWLPARPGIFLARTVEAQTRPQVQQILAAALRADVEASLQQRLGGQP